jgi:hypothetical protein
VMGPKVERPDTPPPRGECESITANADEAILLSYRRVYLRKEKLYEGLGLGASPAVSTSASQALV